MTILVCEDEALIAMDICEELASRGFVGALVARSLQQAMAAIDTGTIEAAIVDLNLKDGRTGQLIARRLAELNVRTVVVSGEELGSDELADCGHVFIRKPAPVGLLVDCLTNSLDLAKTRDTTAGAAA